MTAKQKISIGDTACIDVKVGRTTKLTFDVKVLDIKESYGRTRYLVQPIAGANKALVENLKKK